MNLLPNALTLIKPREESKMSKIDPLLAKILMVKRPTKYPTQNLSVTLNWLKEYEITYVVDDHLNITVEVPLANGLASSTCFTAHTDTVDTHIGVNRLEVDKDGCVKVKGGGVLGADCGSGIYVLINMIITGIPGRYCFFATEEKGRIGSSKYNMPDHILRCISFDRKSTNNLITHQMSERGCSDAFADAFIAAFDLPYEKDPTGSFTDSYSFFTQVPECTNLSVGYYDQHTKQERQDLEFLEKLVAACITMDWESLPAVRDPSVREYDRDDFGYYGYGYGSRRGGAYRGGYGSLTPNYGSSNSTWGDGSEDEELDLYGLVRRYPLTTSKILEEYGITEKDFIDFKEALMDDWDAELHPSSSGTMSTGSSSGTGRATNSAILVDHDDLTDDLTDDLIDDTVDDFYNDPDRVPFGHRGI